MVASINILSYLILITKLTGTNLSNSLSSLLKFPFFHCKPSHRSQLTRFISV